MAVDPSISLHAQAPQIGNMLMQGAQQYQQNKRQDFRDNMLMQQMDNQQQQLQQANMVKLMPVVAGHLESLAKLPPEQRAGAHMQFEAQMKQMGFPVNDNQDDLSDDGLKRAYAAVSGFLPRQSLTPYQQAQLGLQSSSLKLREDELARGREKDSAAQQLARDKLDAYNDRTAKMGGGNGFKDAAKLRNEYIGLTKDFGLQNEAMGRIEASAQDPSAAGDLALIFNYMKMLDPGSTVREGEFATAQNAAGVDDRVRNMFNKIMSGERLAPDQRTDFVSRSKKLYDSAKRQNQRTRNEYTRLATSFNLDPSTVLVDRATFDAEQQPAPQNNAQAGGPAQIQSDADYKALPSGAEFIAPDGSHRRKP